MSGGRVDQTSIPDVLRNHRARIRALEASRPGIEIAHDNVDVGFESKLDFEDGPQYVWNIIDTPGDRVAVSLGLSQYAPTFIQLPLDPRTLGGNTLWPRTVDNSFPYNFTVANADNTTYGYWLVPIAPNLIYTFYLIGVGTTGGKNDITIDAAGPVPPVATNVTAVAGGDWIPILVKTLSNTPLFGLPYFDDFVDNYSVIPNDDYGASYKVSGEPLVKATVFDPATFALNGGPGYYWFRLRCSTGSVKLSYLVAYVFELID